jgi:hypothetical protein
MTVAHVGVLCSPEKVNPNLCNYILNKGNDGIVPQQTRAKS